MLYFRCAFVFSGYLHLFSFTLARAALACSDRRGSCYSSCSQRTSGGLIVVVTVIESTTGRWFFHELLHTCNFESDGPQNQLCAYQVPRHDSRR